MSTSLYALGIGVGTQNTAGEWLEVFYPRPLLNPASELSGALDTLDYAGGNAVLALKAAQLSGLSAALDVAGESALAESVRQMGASSRPLLATILATDTAPESVPEAYLKLHMLSHRLVRPHETDLSGVFAVLRNLALSLIHI